MPNCGLDISQKEIHPIEPVPALPRGGAAPDYADAMFNLALLLQQGSRHKEAADGGNILPTMLNLNGQHAHVDP